MHDHGENDPLDFAPDAALAARIRAHLPGRTSGSVADSAGDCLTASEPESEPVGRADSILTVVTP